MSGKERERLKLFERVKRGELKLKEAAELARLSYRQCRRAYPRIPNPGNLRFDRRHIEVLPLSDGNLSPSRA